MSKLLEKMQTRRSARKYKPDMVPKEIIDKIVTAGTYTAMEMNKQSPIYYRCDKIRNCGISFLS